MSLKVVLIRQMSRIVKSAYKLPAFVPEEHLDSISLFLEVD